MRYTSINAEAMARDGLDRGAATSSVIVNVDKSTFRVEVAPILQLRDRGACSLRASSRHTTAGSNIKGDTGPATYPRAREPISMIDVYMTILVRASNRLRRGNTQSIMRARDVGATSMGACAEASANRIARYKLGRALSFLKA